MGFALEHMPTTEADLLAEFYHQAKLAGLAVKMEVIVPSTLHRSRRMRVDSAVMHNGEIVAFVEGKTPGGKMGGNTRQKHAYEAFKTYFGVPTFWINNPMDIEGLISKLRLLCTPRLAA